MIKKQLFMGTLIIFLFVNLVSAADLGQLFSQVKSELLQKGASVADVNTIQPAVSNLLGLGITKENLVKIAMDLIGLGVSGNTLNSPLEALKDLVRAGEKPNLASNLITLAISQAKAQNLTGNAAVSKIVGIINQKKTEIIRLKEQAQGKIQEQKDKINKSLGSFLGK